MSDFIIITNVTVKKIYVLLIIIFKNINKPPKFATTIIVM